VLFADEAVSALDVSVQATVINLLRELSRVFHFALLFVSHDLSVIRALADTVMVLKDGEAIEKQRADDFFSHPESAYGQSILESALATSFPPRDDRA
jgi:ABC-type microcin C transport system duplicated ATPase subunit YejF